MDFYSDSLTQNIDLRDEMHTVIFGSADEAGQGRELVLRELTNDKCPGCWDALRGGSNRPHCKYCDGEGYLFHERVVTMAVFRGVAPVYKPGILGSGQYPQAEYGYTDPNKATAYCEASVFPNYERYTDGSHPRYDLLFELKVDDEGQTVHPAARTAKWKMLLVAPIHGDFGRVEYIEIGLEKSSVQ